MNYQVIVKLLSYDYKSAAEKIGFTVAGILIALWINRCDEGLKRRNLEEKSLKELYSALNSDHKDIKETLEQVEIDIYAVTRVQQFLKKEVPPFDSLRYFIPHAFAYSFHLANTAAYETLKSRGLDLISNDSLRLKITELYDVTYDYQKKSDDMDNLNFINYVAPVRVKYFIKNPITRMLNSIDYQSIISDATVLTAMDIQYELYYRTREKYRSLDRAVMGIQRQIEAELKHF